MFRQGDVLFRKVRIVIPATARIRENRVVAYGEVTGHAHRVTGDATVFEVADRLLIEVTGTAKVTHQEHQTIPLEKGFYEVIGQREYTPERIRRVTD